MGLNTTHYYLFAGKVLHVVDVHLILKAILAIDAVAPELAKEALSECVGATFGIAHSSISLLGGRKDGSRSSG